MLPRLDTYGANVKPDHHTAAFWSPHHVRKFVFVAELKERVTQIESIWNELWSLLLLSNPPGPLLLPGRGNGDGFLVLGVQLKIETNLSGKQNRSTALSF